MINNRTLGSDAIAFTRLFVNAKSSWIKTVVIRSNIGIPKARIGRSKIFGPSHSYRATTSSGPLCLTKESSARIIVTKSPDLCNSDRSYTNRMAESPNQPTRDAAIAKITVASIRRRTERITWLPWRTYNYWGLDSGNNFETRIPKPFSWIISASSHRV